MATPQYLLKRKPTLIRLEKRGQEVLSNFVVTKGIKREISASQKGYTDIGNQDKRFHCDPEQQRQQQQHIQQQQHQQLLKQKQQEHQIQQLQQKQLQHQLLKHYQAKQEQQATGSQSQPEVAGNENAPFQKGPQVLYQMKVLPNGTLQQDKENDPNHHQEASAAPKHVAQPLQQNASQIKVEHPRQVQFQSSQGTQYQLHFVPNSSGEKQYYITSPEAQNPGHATVSPENQNQIRSSNNQNIQSYNTAAPSTGLRQLLQTQQQYSPPQNWMTLQNQQPTGVWRTSPQQQQAHYSPTNMMTPREKRQKRLRFYTEHLHSLMYREKQEQIRHHQELQSQLRMRIAPTQRQVFVTQYHQRERQHQFKIRQITRLILKLQIFEEVRQRVLQQQQNQNKSPIQPVKPHHVGQKNQISPQQHRGQLQISERQISPQQHQDQQQISPQEHLDQQQISPQQHPGQQHQVSPPQQLGQSQQNGQLQQQQATQGQLQHQSPQQHYSPPQLEINAANPTHLDTSPPMQIKKELAASPPKIIEPNTFIEELGFQLASPKEDLFEQFTREMSNVDGGTRVLNNEVGKVLGKSSAKSDLQQFDMKEVNATSNDNPTNVKEEKLNLSNSVSEQLNFEQLLSSSDISSGNLLNNSDQSKQSFVMENPDDYQVNQFPDIFQFDWQDQHQSQQEEQIPAKVDQNQDLWDELFSIIT